jgi:hypothetical protein
MRQPTASVRPNPAVPPMTCSECGYPSLLVAQLVQQDGSHVGDTVVCMTCDVEGGDATPVQVD